MLPVYWGSRRLRGSPWHLSFANPAVLSAFAKRSLGLFTVQSFKTSIEASQPGLGLSMSIVNCKYEGGMKAYQEARSTRVTFYWSFPTRKTKGRSHVLVGMALQDVGALVNVTSPPLRPLCVGVFGVCLNKRPWTCKTSDKLLVCSTLYLEMSVTCCWPCYPCGK